MENFVLILNIILAILLIAVVLIQKSEGGALGLGISQDSFVSSRSAGSFLTKTTAIIATLFIITSISLTIMSKEKFSSTSVLEKIEEKKDSTDYFEWMAPIATVWHYINVKTFGVGVGPKETEAPPFFSP